MGYVDGFVIPIPRKNVKAYRRMAAAAGKVWMDHGALEFRECVTEDPNLEFGIPFAKLAKAKRGETVLFSFIVFKSRSHRDKVNAKVMKDPRITKMTTDPAKLFEVKRMSYAGFETIVDL